MNKTVTINLSGIVFHIDENAYELLKKYLERLKLHFASTQGKDEIISDIEGRMAEMFTEKNADKNKVIMQGDVNEVIEAMGKPEDLPGDEELKEIPASNIPEASETIRKRFFRDLDDKVFGGVCSGLGEYLNINPNWLRAAFVVFSIAFFFSGLLIYIILWIVIPAAKTASDKLQMRGEAVNVANIEKIREEMEMRKKNNSSARVTNNTSTGNRTTSQSLGDGIGAVLRFIGRLIVIAVAVFIILMSIAVLVGLTIAIFTGIGVVSFIIPHTVTHMVLTTSQLWWLIIGGLLAVGIPFTLLLLNGLKLLFKLKLNLKMISAVMAGMWLVGLGICIITGIQIAGEYQRSAVITTNRMISAPSQKLYVKIDKDPFKYDEDRQDYMEFGDLFILDENADSVMNGLVRFDIEQSENDSTYIVTRVRSRGRTYDEARDLAQQINYRYSVTDSVITLSNYFDMSTAAKYRGQNVKLTLMVPVGKSVVLDKSETLGRMLDNISNVNDTYDWNMLNHEWKMTKEGLECQDCDFDSEDHDDPAHERTSVEIGPIDINVETTTDK